MCVDSYYSLVCKIPLFSVFNMSNELALRTVIATIQELCLVDQPKVTLAEVHENLAAVAAPLESFLNVFK